MRSLLLAAFALALLAGCGTSSFSPAAPKAGALAARKQTNTKAAIIAVPASVFAYMEAHHAKLLAAHDAPGTKVHVAVKLVASRDGFKREKLEATLPAEAFGETGTDRAFTLGMLNGNVQPGEYSYYLVMQGTVVRQGQSRAYLDVLDDFYVSDLGKNYRATLK